MNIGLLISPESWYLEDLRRASGDEHRIVPLSFSELTGRLEDAERRVLAGSTDLREMDVVLVRTMPPGSLEQVVFRMDLLAQLDAIGVPVVNPPRAIEAAVDKYLTSARLHAAGLKVPRTLVCETADEAMEGFGRLGGDVVVKPLFGGEGRGIARLEDPALADRAFRMLQQLGSVIYLQEFIEHEGCDLRVLLAGDRALGMRRRNALDWRTNVSRGARTEPLELTDEWVEIARRAAESVGASLAGVDLLPGRDGALYVLEVNAVPGWRALARTTGVDVAQVVLDHLASVVKDRSRS